MSEGHKWLQAWFADRGITESELARLIREAARRHKLIDAPSSQNVRMVRRWLAGESTPKHSSRALIEMIALIPVEAWTREAGE
jgi:hypothetical protein